MITKLLSGHVSPETAFQVDSYPYGGLRCKKRWWLEFKKNKGFRLCSQTTNPKRKLPMVEGSQFSGDWWNTPKASTYSRFGGAMYLDEINHVQWSGLHEYMDLKESREWVAKYGAGVPEIGREAMEIMLTARERIEKQKQRGEIVMVTTMNGKETERETLAPKFPEEANNQDSADIADENDMREAAQDRPEGATC